MASEMSVKVEKNELVIRMPLQKPTPSKSGKTKIVATTNGFTDTEAKIDGATVSISLNATIPNK